MDQTLRRLVIILSASLVVACGSDDGKTENSQTEDAAVDAGGDDEKDAAPSGSGGRGGRGGSGGGRAGSGGSGGSTSAKSCDDLDCAEPATCKEADGKASCACPTGYEDVKGDGSECKDIDECAGDKNDCALRATCENKPGGYECTCKTPAYKGDGKTCDCAEGYTFDEAQRVCRAPNGTKCGDDIDCASDSCVGGTCCGNPCNTPDAECKSAKKATCEDGVTCVYPVSDDGEACDDGNACLNGSVCQGGACQAGSQPLDCDDENPCTDDSCDATIGCKNTANTATCNDGNACTMNDVCSNGTCGSTTVRDCSASADTCNTGTCDPATGACGKTPVADGTLCNDTSSCTTTDQCNAGTCTGQGNACGPNASACTPGTPNDCTCNASYLEEAGLCVPENNECDANPCDTNATCFDPSNNPGDVTCKCDAGFEGNGTTCTATNPCAGNPCGEGRGTCTNGTAGAYTCSCAAGFTEVGGTCGCDLKGTFALRTTYELAWSNIDGAENGEATSFGWALIRLDASNQNGSLELESINCGESEVDLCGQGGAFIGTEAYAQFGDRKAFGIASSQVSRVLVPLEEALPNSPFVTPQYAQLTGISLTDPLGPWPARRQDVEGGPDFDGSATNGARWLDSDGDSAVGVTTYAVPPGGISSTGDGPRPLRNYGATSEDCPRSNPGAPRYAYAYPPAADGLNVRRIKRFSSANRIVSALNGTIDSCDEVSGNVIGPSNGLSRIEGVIGGCIRDNNGGDAACSSAVLDFLGGGEQSQDIQSATFTMQRVADTVTCEQIRAMNF